MTEPEPLTSEWFEAIASGEIDPPDILRYAAAAALEQARGRVLGQEGISEGAARALDTWFLSTIEEIRSATL